MGMKNYILLLMASVLCTGCATMDPTSRTIVGSQVGMLAGTVTGAVIGHSVGGYRGEAIGSFVGSVGGTVVGARLLHLKTSVIIIGYGMITEVTTALMWLLKIFIWKTVMEIR